MLVVDLSNNQGACNIEAAAGAVDGFVFKATEGPGFRDGFFADWARRAKALGKWHGAYDFGHPGRDDARASANTFCDVVSAIGRPPRLVLDLEVTHTNPANTTAWAVLWFHTVAGRMGAEGLTTYTYPYFAPSFTADPVLSTLADLWIAAYPLGYQQINTPPAGRTQGPVAPWSRQTAWQFTSSGRIPGVNGAVDLSTCQPDWVGAQPHQEDELASLIQSESHIIRPGELAVLSPPDGGEVVPGRWVTLFVTTERPAGDEVVARVIINTSAGPKSPQAFGPGIGGDASDGYLIPDAGGSALQVDMSDPTFHSVQVENRDPKRNITARVAWVSKSF